MKIGVSTASLYPMHTEDALLEVARLGVANVEIFLNSTIELDGEIFSVIKNTVDEYKINVLAVHPFTSPIETVFLFSAYDRRVNSMMEEYKRHFEFMNKLGAKIFVVHGVASAAKCPNERYIERLYGLICSGKEHGITVAQENVAYCKSGNIDFLEMVSQELGNDAHFVIDTKQARRKQTPPGDFLDRLGDKIVHLHLSDGASAPFNDNAEPGTSRYHFEKNDSDCLPIGVGNFDFIGFFGHLERINYKGSAVVELYREGFKDIPQLADCVAKLKFISENLGKLLV